MPSTVKTITSTLIGRDPAMREVLDLVKQVAATDATVLITGETGTGKELIARDLVRLSERRDQAFLALNCGAVPDSLQESELFGHVRGAFTGATVDRAGWFEAADRGTLFLDEVEQMAPPLQAKLLRVLQTGEYTPVGATGARQCDVRIIAATNRDLESMVETGAFRRDLYYRLNIIPIDLPPLRRRRGDIPLLIEHFLNRYAALYDRRLIIDATAMSQLIGYDYPGNVRELENLIHRAVVLGREPVITPRHLPLRVTAPAGVDDAPLEPSADHGVDDDCRGSFHDVKARLIERFERGYLIRRLRESRGVISAAARAAGLSERNFHSKLKQYQITRAAALGV